jgi:hypothetical protein
MPDAEEIIDESYVDETALEFPEGKFATPPYPLRLAFFPLSVMGIYWGDALRFDRHWFEASFGYNLCVPPNVMAVVLLANGERRALIPGRYSIGSRICRVMANGVRRYVAPVSVQYVTTKVRSCEFSYAFKALNVKYRDEKNNEKERNLTIHVQLALQVIDPLKVTELEDPVEDVKGALKQELIKAFVSYPYDEFYAQRNTLNAAIKENLNRLFAEHHGLAVADVLLIQIDPADASWIDLSQRGSLVNRNSEVRRREAQMEEDIFALEQPYVMRMAQTTINRLNAERDYAARLQAIEALQELATAISEDLHNHPGRYAPGEMETLKGALALLEKFGSATPGIKFAPLRSWYSKENYPPPGTPPAEAPLTTPPPAAIDPNFVPKVMPSPAAQERADKAVAPFPPPPPIIKLVPPGEAAPDKK